MTSGCVRGSLRVKMKCHIAQTELTHQTERAIRDVLTPPLRGSMSIALPRLIYRRKESRTKPLEERPEAGASSGVRSFSAAEFGVIFVTASKLARKDDG